MTPTAEHPIAGTPPPAGNKLPPKLKSTPPSGPPPTITPFAAGADDNVSGVAAYGTLIQVLAETGPPEVFVSIEGVGDITGPNTQIAEAETTSHSTGAPIRTFLPTLIDPGELTFPCFWNPSDPTQAASSPYGMERLFYDRTVTDFLLVNTDATHRTRRFKGYVKSLGETYPMAGICTRNISIRITSPMVDQIPAINVTPDTVSLTSTGTPTAPIELSAGGSFAPWVATTVDSWIHITAPVGPTVGDGSITFTVDANDAVTPPAVTRTGYIHVAALNLSVEVTQTATP